MDIIAKDWQCETKQLSKSKSIDLNIKKKVLVDMEDT